LVGWLVGQLVSWSVGQLLAWLVGLFIHLTRLSAYRRVCHPRAGSKLDLISLAQTPSVLAGPPAKITLR